MWRRIASLHTTTAAYECDRLRVSSERAKQLAWRYTRLPACLFVSRLGVRLFRLALPSPRSSSPCYLLLMVAGALSMVWNTACWISRCGCSEICFCRCHRLFRSPSLIASFLFSVCCLYICREMQVWCCWLLYTKKKTNMIF